MHCVTISACKMLRFGSELQENLSQVKDELESTGIMLFAEGEEVILSMGECSG